MDVSISTVSKALKDSPEIGEEVTYNEDKVVVALNAIGGVKKIAVATIFEDGTKVQDAYSGQEAEVTNGIVTITSEFDIVLLELAN